MTWFWGWFIRPEAPLPTPCGGAAGVFFWGCSGLFVLGHQKTRPLWGRVSWFWALVGLFPTTSGVDRFADFVAVDIRCFVLNDVVASALSSHHLAVAPYGVGVPKGQSDLYRAVCSAWQDDPDGFAVAGADSTPTPSRYCHDGHHSDLVTEHLWVALATLTDSCIHLFTPFMGLIGLQKRLYFMGATEWWMRTSVRCL